MTRIVVWRGDITSLELDGIVNAANNSLMGGGGVDGVIHRAAGPELQQECALLGGCPTGEARITRGYRLKARHVIHTVGPVWHGGEEGESALLAACYANCLAVGREYGLTSLAFPAISTGVYGYPPSQAARLAVRVVSAILDDDTRWHEIILCAFDEKTEALYRQELGRLIPAS